MAGRMQIDGRNDGRNDGQAIRIAVWGGAGALLLAPAIADRLTDEVSWDRSDFILFGVMLAAACAAWEVAIRRTRSRTYAAGAIAAAGAALLLLLVNAAVGFIGNEDDPVNLIFFGVLTVAAGGAVIVRFTAEGLARTMAVTAAAQVAAGALGVAMVPDMRGFLLGTALFVPLWLLSSRLFARAAVEERA